MHPDLTLPATFLARVLVTDTCWLWAGAVRPDGYGTLSVKRRPTLAHRRAYELAYGQPAAEQVQHLCDVNYAPGDLTYRRCVRPKHLTTGTPAENLEHMVQVGRAATGSRSGAARHPESILRGEQRPNAVLTDTVAREIRELYATGGVSKVDLAERFGVLASVVQSVTQGRRYLEAGGPIQTAHAQRRKTDGMAQEMVSLWGTGDWTQGTLAERFGVSRSLVGRVLRATGIHVGRGRRV